MVTAYVSMCADGFHYGHLNILMVAKKLSDRLIIGLLTDEAIEEYKSPPIQDYDMRFDVLNSICLPGSSITSIHSQKTHSYLDNLNKYKPDLVIHGDDWLDGDQVHIRDEVFDWCKDNNAYLIEPPYTPGISSTQIKENNK